MPHPDIQKSPSTSAPNVLKSAQVIARDESKVLSFTKARWETDIGVLGRVHWNTKASVDTDEEPNYSIYWEKTNVSRQLGSAN